MILTPLNLPSQGKFTLESGSIEVLPLTYKQLVDYVAHPEASEILKYKKDILMLQLNGVRLNQVSLLDLDFLIYIQKSITIDEGLKYNTTVPCKSCGYELTTTVDSTEFSFLDYEYSKVPSKVTINDVEYKILIPRVSDFLDCMDKYLKYAVQPDLDDIRLLSLFPEYPNDPRNMERIILGARGKDAAKLLWLSDLIFNRVKPIEVSCPNCSKGGETTIVNINIDHVNSTFFRDFLGNNPITEDEVHFEQICEDE